MEEIFITKIQINKVRHLENIEIPIDEKERKHLILTGKNGSGKTSVLNYLKQYLTLFQGAGITYNGLLQLKKDITNWQNVILSNEYQMKNPNLTEQQIQNYNNSILNSLNAIKKNQASIDSFEKTIPEIKSALFLEELYKQGNFILCFFDAKRNSKFQEPNGIHKLTLKNTYQLDEKAGNLFLQYIVNLKADRSFARDDEKQDVIKSIDEWFFKFEGLLKEIFNDPNLSLEFDSKNYTFHIITSNREKIGFNTLSDGYSAILNIVIELILRMEEKSSKIYDMQGIVLIDEIETHLHIELQKKVLPFLTTLFPKVQFIVSSHSPFVLNSIENAVVYDLENKIRVTDLSAYSIDGIVENYFDIDKYSKSIKEKIQEYENLVSKKEQTDKEKERLLELRILFKKIPEDFAPELVAFFQQIEIGRLGQ
ncbi:MAG TPA: AAA family ATPase [Leptospiraceae bacterium]|nr:AAA family ATPase [Leptospiraceae bacterium]